MAKIKINQFVNDVVNWDSLNKRYYLFRLSSDRDKELKFQYDVFFEHIKNAKLSSVVSCLYNGFGERAVYILFKKDNNIDEHDYHIALHNYTKENCGDSGYHIQIIKSEQDLSFYRKYQDSTPIIRQLFLNAVTWQDPFNNSTGRCLIVQKTRKAGNGTVAPALELRVDERNILSFKVVTFASIQGDNWYFWNKGKKRPREQFLVGGNYMRRCKYRDIPNDEILNGVFVQKKPWFLRNRKEELAFLLKGKDEKSAKLYQMHNVLESASNIAGDIISFVFKEIDATEIRSYKRNKKQKFDENMEMISPVPQDKLWDEMIYKWTTNIHLDICFARDCDSIGVPQSLYFRALQNAFASYFKSVECCEMSDKPYKKWDGLNRVGMIILGKDRNDYQGQHENDPYYDKENVLGVSVRLTSKTVQQVIIDRNDGYQGLIRTELMELREIADIRQQISSFYLTGGKNLLESDLLLCTKNPNPGKYLYKDEALYFSILSPNGTMKFIKEGVDTEGEISDKQLACMYRSIERKDKPITLVGMTEWKGKTVNFGISLGKIYPLPNYREFYDFVKAGREVETKGLSLRTWYNTVSMDGDKTYPLVACLKDMIKNNGESEYITFSGLKKAYKEYKTSVNVFPEDLRKKLPDGVTDRSMFLAVQKIIKEKLNIDIKLNYRSGEIIDRYYRMMLGLHAAFMEDGKHIYYWRGQNGGIRASVLERGTPAREIYLEGLCDLDERKEFLYHCLLPFLTFEHIKWGEDTAWPMPYKYLREFINLHVRETAAGG